MMHLAERCPVTTLRVTTMGQSEFDALPTTQQPTWTFDTVPTWWREGQTIVRYTGRWSPYGD